MDGHTSASNDVIELFIVLALILLNGVFALSELAVVSARVPRLRALAATSHPGAASALALALEPGRFLSAVQIGITLIGIINGAYSGEAFGDQASAFFRELGLSPAAASVVGAVIVRSPTRWPSIASSTRGPVGGGGRSDEHAISAATRKR